MNTLERIYENKLVAVIRGAEEKDVLSITQALCNGGISVFEITAETPGVLRLIERIKSEMGDAVTVGAGTVLDAETARAAIMAGAEFIFSPTVNVDTIRITKRYGVVSIPGAMTPTEILTAYEHGADIIKVFPANILGPRYIKDIHGPLPHIPLMPTGGVSLDNIQQYLSNGAVAMGLGSSLLKTNIPLNKQTLTELEERSAMFVNEVKSFEDNRI